MATKLQFIRCKVKSVRLLFVQINGFGGLQLSSNLWVGSNVVQCCRWTEYSKTMLQIVQVPSYKYTV